MYTNDFIYLISRSLWPSRWLYNEREARGPQQFHNFCPWKTMGKFHVHFYINKHTNFSNSLTVYLEVNWYHPVPEKPQQIDVLNRCGVKLTQKQWPVANHNASLQW